MLNLLGYIFFVFAGLFFGLFGSGGSIIMLPILVYIFKLPFEDAKIYSLLLIFLIAFFGTIKHQKENKLHLQKILFFILPTLLFTGLSTVFLFPKIPLEIEFFNISKKSFLMILFSIVIFFAAISLLRPISINTKYNSKAILVLIGILVGVLTGLLGVGGGFIIVPSLILFAHMDMKKAASTALFIIMLNTLLAVPLGIFSINNFQFNWQFILLLFLSSLIGVVLGINLLNKIEVNLTKKIFSISLLLLSLSIFFIELLL